MKKHPQGLENWFPFEDERSRTAVWPRWPASRHRGRQVDHGNAEPADAGDSVIVGDFSEIADSTHARPKDAL